MTNDYNISIIIPSYNSHKTIASTIEHLIDQDQFSHVCEIIIVDSSDDQHTKKYLNSISHERIRIITSGIKVIPAIQRNIGAQHAKGDLLIFIDSDAYPSEKWLLKIMSAYAEGWKVGGGGILVPEFQQRNKIALAQYYFEFGEYIPVGMPRIKKILPSCNLFCDKLFFQSISGFPNIRAAEDALFCLHAGKTTNLIFIPDATVYHIFRESITDFLRNQFLLGKYIYIYRKSYFNSFFLKGFSFYLLLPLMLTYKILVRLTIVCKAGPSHYVQFLKSWRYFFMATISWFKGFIEGKKGPVNYDFGSFS